MEYQDKAKDILEKYKKEKKVSSASDEIIMDRVEGALNAIISAEEQMTIDAEKVNNPMREERAGYGFMWNRFGDRTMHPGITIIEKQKNIISKCFQELGVVSEPEKQKGTLDKLIVTGGKKKAG